MMLDQNQVATTVASAPDTFSQVENIGAFAAFSDPRYLGAMAQCNGLSNSDLPSDIQRLGGKNGISSPFKIDKNPIESKVTI